MPIRYLTFLVFLLGLYNCDSKNEDSIEDTVIDGPPPLSKEAKQPDQANNLVPLHQWESYYAQKNPAFDIKDFSKQETFELTAHASETPAVWESDFNPVYKRFLRYNQDSTMYIDFMSYKLQFDDDNEVILAPDQEVLLVDIAHQEVKQLLFYGPSYWIEDAYFKNDSTVVLLENSDEKKPAYQEINLHTLKSDYYTYPKTLDFSSDYLKEKILKAYQKNL